MIPDAFVTAHPRRRQLLKGALAASLPFALARPVRAAPRAPLVIGGLPVTCNLTLPVACAARAASNARAGGGRTGFEFSKYSGWAEVKE
jgi:NitT/TauT family transport system substrate-binding protein